MINVVLGALIFSYAGYSLTKCIKKGKCAACFLNKSCPSSCNVIEEK
ncbi:FeoB-associated Cys-rich membrane protein [Ectobacillus panaciterrae]|nr:FeoB-associated Cys-rich membrane protein [Ectobacillus panaciterrae]